MDPELRKLLETAQRAREAGVSMEEINKALQGRGAPNFAELSAMAQPKEPPKKPSLMRQIGLIMEGRFSEDQPPFGTSGTIQEQLQPQADVTRMVGRGATLGLLEEALAIPRLLPGGKTWGEARQEGQEETARARERLGPGLSFASEMTGAGMIPGRAAAALVSRGPSIASKMGRASGVGAGVGATVGAADAPGEDLGLRTVTGTVLGATFGAALPLAGAILTVPGKIASIIWGVFSPTRAGQRVSRAHLRALGKVLSRSPEELETEFARQYTRRPGLVTPADTDPLIGAVAQTQAPAASGKVTPLVERVQARPIGRGERLAEDLPGLTRTGRLETAQAAAQGRLTALSPQLYKPLEAAYPSVTDPRLTKFLENPRIKKFWNRVKPDEGEPGLAHWQELRGELQDAINSLQRRGKSFARRRTTGQREELTAILEDIVPGYRAANLQYAQTASTIRAFDTGAKAYKKFMSGDEVTRALGEVQQVAGPDAANAVEAFRHGYVDELVRGLLAKSGKSTAQRLASMNASQQQALRAVFPDEGSFSEFLERAVLENRLSTLDIRTGARAVQMASEGGVQSGLVSPFVGLRYIALRELFRRGGPEKLRAAADATLTKLLSTDPGAMARLTAAMRAPGGGGPGLLTGALPGPVSGLLQRR